MKLRETTEKVLFWAGPLLAGFNVASHVLAFFGVGAIASWLIQKWFPFTRWIWVQVFDFFEWPIIGDVEKDALTTLTFFLPLGFWALLQSEEDVRNSEYKTAGRLSGLFFVLVVSKGFFGNVLDNAITIMLNIGYWTIGGIALCTFFAAFLVAYISRNKWNPESDKEVEWELVYDMNPSASVDAPLVFGKQAAELRKEASEEWERKKAEDRASIERKIATRKKDKMSLREAYILLDAQELSTYTSQVVYQTVIQFFVTLLFMVLLIGFILFFGSIGLVTAYCLVLICILCYSAIVFSPYRLYVTIGVVAAFVIAGLFYDATIWAINLISGIEL